MSSSWTRAFGLSMTVCLLAIMAAPALAADPAHVRPAFTVPRGPVAGVAGRGMHLLTTLQVMGIPVVGPVAALSYAEYAIQRLTFRPTTERTLPVNLSWRAGSRSFNESAFPRYIVSRGQTGAAALGLAENLTAYLSGKGYGVADLNEALSVARTALAASNLTAFRVAMITFREDLNTKITAGTMNRTVIQDYLKTLPAMHPATAEWTMRGRRARISERPGW
jgi:hypothetical protein